MTIAKTLRQKRAAVVEAARKHVDKENPTAEDSAAFDAAMAEADALKAQIDRVEKADALDAELREQLGQRAEQRRISPDQLNSEDEAERRAYGAYLRGGISAVAEADRPIAHRAIAGAQQIQAALGTGDGSAGGYTVPTSTEAGIITSMKAFGGLLEVCREFVTGSGSPINYPTNDDTGNKGARVAENAQVSEGDTTFGSKTLNAYNYSSKIMRVPLSLLTDSAADIEAHIRGLAGERLGRIQNEEFTVADGDAKPQGVVPAAATGKTGASGQTTSVTYDDLIDLQHSVNRAYRSAARFMLADSTVKAVRKLKDGEGRPIWQPSVQLGQPDILLGHAVSINDDVPAMAAGAKSILFGDFRHYFWRRLPGITMLRLVERYADYLQVGFLAHTRADGELMDAGAIKAYANAAS